MCRVRGNETVLEIFCRVYFETFLICDERDNKIYLSSSVSPGESPIVPDPS